MSRNLYEELNQRVLDTTAIDEVKAVLGMEAPPLTEEEEIQIEDILGAPVASKHNQHAIVMIVGKTGEGKSRAGLFIGYRVAKYLARQLGGVWQDYFSSENIAVMTTGEVIRVMKANKPKKVLILDDIGAAWNSRDWNSKGNKILNRIVMTFRNKNNLLILTLPDSFILDKVPRNLLHYHIEMFKQEYDDGLSIYKLFKVVRRYRSGKTYFVHPRLNGVKYVAGAIEDAEIPIDLIQEYEARRNRIQEEAEAKDMEDFEALAAELEDPPEPKGVAKHQIELDKAFAVHELNMTEGVSIRKGCKMLNIQKDKYYKLKNENTSMFALSV